MDDFTLWTPDGATRLREAADALAEAIRAHASTVTAVSGEEGTPEVMAAGSRLLPALLAYADAEFDYTGTSFPLGSLYEFDDDDDDEADETPARGVSVLRRSDYAVADEEAVMEAGRQAYLRVWPEDGAEAAAADVTHLGRALYQIAHADGWDALDEVEGLRPTGGVVLVQPSDELLGADPDQWPEDALFDYDDDLLIYRQDDIIVE